MAGVAEGSTERGGCEREWAAAGAVAEGCASWMNEMTSCMTNEQNNNNLYYMR